MSVIELDNLSKWYGEVIGLNNVTASVGRGITGLLGPNGAGKSTLMGLAMGQLHPSQGTIRVFGKKVWNKPAVLSQIGYCPESDPFWTNLTGRQFVTFLAKASGLPRRKARDAADSAIAATGMTEHAGRSIKGYSKGMRQRIKMAQALAHRPKLLILDEPFTGADPVAHHDLADLLRGLAEDGVDILVSSHVLHEVEALTKQIVMIDHGRIVAQGVLHTVRQTMHDRPHTIKVRVDQPRKLAVRLAEMDVITGLKITPPETLLLETPTPGQVYERLSDLILDEGISVLEIAPDDEGLEAVFGYLTQQAN